MCGNGLDVRGWFVCVMMVWMCDMVPMCGNGLDV